MHLRLENYSGHVVILEVGFRRCLTSFEKLWSLSFSSSVEPAALSASYALEVRSHHNPREGSKAIKSR